MILCNLYLRLSDGRNENGSFVDREAKLRKRAEQLGWTVRRVEVENDHMMGSKSASAFEQRKIRLADGSTVMRVWRPGFRSILADLETGRVHALLAEDLDRAVRDPRDLEDLIEVVEKRRAWADSLSGSLRFTDGGTDAEITMARMMVAVGNKESRDKRRRVKAARERQAVGGVWGDGIRPYGFTPIPCPSGNHQNTQLAVDPVEAAVIRDAADAVLSGVALGSVARDLNEKGVPTARDTRWTTVTLRSVLMKPSVAGIVVYQGDEVGRLPGEPILTEDTWRTVVAKLKDPTAEISGPTARATSGPPCGELVWAAPPAGWVPGCTGACASPRWKS